MRSNQTITTSVINRERQTRSIIDVVTLLPGTSLLLEPRFFHQGLGHSGGSNARGMNHGMRANYAHKPSAPCWSYTTDPAAAMAKAIRT